MNFDILKIEQILNKIDLNSPDDFQYNKGKCWEMWIKNFYTKDNEHEQINKNLSFIEKINLMKEFEKTNATENDFKKIYPDFKYDKYRSPWDYDYKLVSQSKIQKVAFELQEYFPLKYNQLCDLLKTIYWTNSREKWNFDTLVLNLVSYDTDLYLKATIFLQLTKNKLVA